MSAQDTTPTSLEAILKELVDFVRTYDYDPTLAIDDAKAAITQWAVSKAPEKLDESKKHLFTTQNGTQVDVMNVPYCKGFNKSVEAYITNLTQAEGRE